MNITKFNSPAGCGTCKIIQLLLWSICFLGIFSGCSSNLFSFDHSSQNQNQQVAIPAEKTDATKAEMPASLRKAFTAARQQIVPVDDGYRAVNLRQQLNILFDQTGVLLSPVNRDATWHIGMQLTGLGYKGAVQPVEKAKLVAKGKRMEFRRGNLTEWYINDQRGLEQGFTLSQSPDSSLQGNQPLLLDITLTGGLEARVDANGTGLSFLDASGASLLAYHELVAFDATGKKLPARLALLDDNLRIEVDDANAVYPVIIDPWIEQQKLVRLTGAPYDYFGESIAISGDTAIVGAYATHGAASAWHAGSVYVFVHDPLTDTWDQQAKLTALDASSEARFGFSVALNGDMALIGALGAFGGLNSSIYNAGSAYVFQRTGTTWSQQTKLTASDAKYADTFGTSIALNGDTALVGAIMGDGQVVDTGAAYVFVRDPVTNTWSEQSKLIAPDGALRHGFGGSVALSADTALIGASQYDGTSVTSPGTAYIFVRTGTTWCVFR